MLLKGDTGSWKNMHNYLPSSEENEIESRVLYSDQLPAQPKSRIKSSAMRSFHSFASLMQALRKNQRT